MMRTNWIALYQNELMSWPLKFVWIHWDTALSGRNVAHSTGRYMIDEAKMTGMTPDWLTFSGM